ncbi:MAG TPA: hypothetical protein VIY49_28110 [Bryobacteraceae bacterium]
MILRTGAIAVLTGAAFATFSGRFARWPLATVLALWPSFGGHWVEVWFLNRLRPRLSSLERAQRIRCGLPLNAHNAFAVRLPLNAHNAFAVRLPARGVQVATRVLLWFIAGAGLVFAMRLSLPALALVWPAHWPVWWVGGFAFMVVELVTHLVLQLRGRPNFYNGLG